MLLTSDPNSPDLGQPPKRGIYPALLKAGALYEGAPDSTSSANGAPTTSGSRLVDRLSDDPQTRHASIDDSTNDLESRVSTTAAPHYRPVAPDEHMQQLESQYQQYATPQQQPKRPLWQKIGLGLLAAAGGGAGLARGEQIRNQRFDQQQQMRQQRAESLLSQIEAERRMQEQEDIEGQRMQEQERMGNLRAQMQQQGENERNQRLIETIQAQNQRQQEQFGQQADQQQKQFQHADESQQRQFGEQEKLAHIRQANQGGVTLIVPGPNGTQTVQRVMPGQSVANGAMTPGQFGPQQLKTDMANRQTQSVLHSFTRYQQHFHELSPQLTPADREAMQVLASHQDVIAQGLMGAANSWLGDLVSREPMTGYSQKLMQGVMMKDQYDQMSPAGKRMLADYFHAIVANFINMKQRMGTAGGRNQAMVQAEMNAIPLPYIDSQSADAMFNDTIEDINNFNPGGGNAGNAGGGGGRRVIDLTK